MGPNANDLSLGVTEFVTLLNQTFDFAYPSLLITGELANLRISKNKWVYPVFNNRMFFPFHICNANECYFFIKT